MKKIPLLAAVLVLGASLPGCGASIIKKPEVLSVKKMAIVSVVMNTDTYNIEQAKQKSGLDVRALKKMVGMEEDIDTDQYLQLVTAGLDSYHKELGSMSQWELIPAAEVIDNESYKSSQWQAKPFFVSPPGMHQIHYGDVAKTGTTTYVDGKEVHEEARKKLGQLAKDLGVDGVVIIEIDFGYEPVFLSGMKGTGLLSGIRAPAKPSVSSSMVIISKDGAIAAQSPAVVKGGGTRYAGDKVNMIHQGKVDLKDKDGASVKEAARTIGLSAAGLKAKLLKEFESN
jgi:hypothetical protein